MLSFTTKYSGLSNVLKNEVQVAQSSVKASPTFTRPYIGLWDTGATCSVITQKIVDDLNLKPISYGKVYTSKDSYDTPFFYVDILLPNKVIIPKLRVPLGNPFGCDLLVGMDIIGKGDFAVSNYNGMTVFTYRFPSIMEFDFVNDKNFRGKT